MFKLCFALGLLQGSQNLLNKESSCFCFDFVDARGWLESDDSLMLEILYSVVCCLRSRHLSVFFVAMLSALRRHSNN